MRTPPRFQQHFLPQSIIGIAAIKCAGQRAVRLRVRRQIGIQEINRNFKTAHALLIAPATQFNAAVFQRNAGSRRFFRQEIFRAPLDRLFGSASLFGETLREKSFAVKQRGRPPWASAGPRRRESCRPQNAQSAAVARHGVFRAQSPSKNKRLIVLLN